MSDNDTHTAPDTPATPPALAPVEVTLELPGRLYHDYSLLVGAGLYMNTEEALRHAVITSWRFDRGTYHTLRLDFGSDDEEAAEKAGKADQEPAPGAEA